MFLVCRVGWRARSSCCSHTWARRELCEFGVHGDDVVITSVICLLLLYIVVEILVHSGTRRLDAVYQQVLLSGLPIMNGCVLCHSIMKTCEECVCGQDELGVQSQDTRNIQNDFKVVNGAHCHVQRNNWQPVTTKWKVINEWQALSWANWFYILYMRPYPWMDTAFFMGNMSKLLIAGAYDRSHRRLAAN